MSSTDRIGMPGSTSASGTFGVTTCAAGSSSDRIASTASASSSRSPPFAIMTGSTTTCGRSSSRDRGGDRLDDRGVGEHADLDRVGADVADDRFDLRGHQVGGHAPPRQITPSVFCAVTAVIADVPKTPCAANVFRSAWMPAPPPESLPAIVSACGAYSIDYHRLMTRFGSDRGGTLLRPSLARVANCASGIRVAAVLFVTALTAAAAQISIPLPFTPVPFTLQPMVVLLGGAALGSRLGMSRQVLYLLRRHRRPSGLRRVAGAAAGLRCACSARPAAILLSYPVAAFVAGWLAERGFDRRYLTSVARDGLRAWPSSSPAASPGSRCSRSPPASASTRPCARASIRSSRRTSSRS